MEDEHVTFWYIPRARMEKGQGKRVNGMTAGGMSAMVNFSTRIETTISQMREHAGNITQNTVRINYKDVLMFIAREDIKIFLGDPDSFILERVRERVTGLEEKTRINPAKVY